MVLPTPSVECSSWRLEICQARARVWTREGVDRPRTWTFRKNSSPCLLPPPLDGGRDRARPPAGSGAPRGSGDGARDGSTGSSIAWSSVGTASRDRRARLMKNGHRGGLWTRFRGRLLSGAERLELLEELLLIRWNRFLLHSLRALGTLPGPGVPRRCGRRGRRLPHPGLRDGPDASPRERREDRLRLQRRSFSPATGVDIAPTREASAPPLGGHPPSRRSAPGRNTRTMTSGTDSRTRAIGTSMRRRGRYGALRYGRSGGDRVPASPTGSPRAGVRSARRTGHRAVQWLRDARDGDSTNRSGVPIDIRRGDGARCGRDLDPIRHHHHQWPRWEPRDRGSVPEEADLATWTPSWR